MKYVCALIAVSDLERSKRFYRELLGCEVLCDFGENVTLSGGFSLQTLDSWKGFLRRDVTLGGAQGELYFEEDDMGAFLERLAARDDVALVHPPLEHTWGQRAVRFYDPDRHIVEVGESMVTVVRRFVEGGLSPKETAARMDVPEDYVRSCLA